MKAMVSIGANEKRVYGLSFLLFSSLYGGIKCSEWENPNFRHFVQVCYRVSRPVKFYQHTAKIQDEKRQKIGHIRRIIMRILLSMDGVVLLKIFFVQ